MRRSLAKAQSRLNTASISPHDTSGFDVAVALFSAVRQVSDEVLHAHEGKVGEISGILGAALGLDVEEVTALIQAASLHDIGKFAIPAKILGKTGPLTPEELLEIQRHPVNGAQILINAGYGPDDAAVQAARHHHEKFDGSGYPDGLSGTEIPLAARITAVADVYDALRALRPYKKPIDHKTALKIILEGDDRTRPEHFDPEILAALLAQQALVKAVWEEPTTATGRLSRRQN